MPPPGSSPQDTCIAVIGSSTVWGKGLLGEGSLVGTLDEHLRDRWSRMVQPEAMRFSGKSEVVKNRKFFRGDAIRISGVGAFVEFELESDELVIWHALARTTDYGEITVSADGRVIDVFENRNPTLGQERKRFVGDGRTRLFALGRAFTYGHRVLMNGRELRFKSYDLNYVSGPVAARFPGFDGVVVRARPEEKVEHFLYFFQPPVGEVEVSYQYGETVGYVACTVGGTADENLLESPYGLGDVPFDATNPTQFSTGLDFRFSNPLARRVYRFPNVAGRKFRLELTGGRNPYFLMDFVSDRAHDLINAGIGGFTAGRFLTDRQGRAVADVLKIAVPDIALIVLGGNDDWAERERLVHRERRDLTEAEVRELRSMTLAAVKPQPDGRFTAVLNSGLVDALTPTSLTSRHLVGAEVAAGHYLRIGDYHGDNLSTVVRRVSGFDRETGTVFWREPLRPETIVGVETLADLCGAEFTIRTLRTYRERIAAMIETLRRANPAMRIVLLQTYTPNYFMREVWGYGEALEDVAARYSNCTAVDVSPAIHRWIATQLTGRSRTVLTATGAREYVLPWRGHHQGFRVMVNDRDVYGREAYIESGWYYLPEKDPRGEWKVGRTSKLTVAPMKLVFTGNPPSPGTAITVIRADQVWSRDFAHPTPAGCVVIGDIAFDALAAFPPESGAVLRTGGTGTPAASAGKTADPGQRESTRTGAPAAAER